MQQIRTHLAKEFIQDLNNVAEENSNLLRETLQGSLANMMSSLEDVSSTASDLSDDDAPAAAPQTPLHPEVAEAIQKDKPAEAKPPEQKRPRGRWTGLGRQAASDDEVEMLQQRAAEQAAAAAAAAAAEQAKQEAAQKAAGSSAAPGDAAGKSDVADVLLKQLQQAKKQQGQSSVMHPELAEMLAPGADEKDPSSSPGVYELLMQQLRQQQGGAAASSSGDAQAPGGWSASGSPTPDEDEDDKQAGTGK